MTSERSSASVLLLKSALMWHRIIHCKCAGCGMDQAVILHRAWWHRTSVNLMGVGRLWQLCMRRSTSSGLSCPTGSCWTLMTRSTCWISLLVCLLLVPPPLPCPALPSYATDNTLPMCFHVLSFTQTLLMFNMAGSTFTLSHSHLVFTHKPLLHPDPNLRATARAALQPPFLSTTPPQATTIMSTAAAAVFPTSAISLQPPAVVAGASALQHVSPTSCVQPVVDMQPEVSPDSLACKSSSGFTTVEQLPTAAEDEGPNFTADSASSVPCIVSVEMAVKPEQQASGLVTVLTASAASHSMTAQLHPWSFKLYSSSGSASVSSFTSAVSAISQHSSQSSPQGQSSESVEASADLHVPDIQGLQHSTVVKTVHIVAQSSRHCPQREMATPDSLDAQPMMSQPAHAEPEMSQAAHAQSAAAHPGATASLPSAKVRCRQVLMSCQLCRDTAPGSLQLLACHCRYCVGQTLYGARP